MTATATVAVVIKPHDRIAELEAEIARLRARLTEAVEARSREISRKSHWRKLLRRMANGEFGAGIMAVAMEALDERREA